MSVQGVIGVFPFTVTDAMVATFRNLKRDREIAYAEHKVVAGLPKLQHTGRELDKVTLQIIIHPIIADGLSVDARVLALRELAKLGMELPLVLGFGYYGLYVIKSVGVVHTHMHRGSTWSATIDLGLQEYN